MAVAVGTSTPATLSLCRPATRGARHLPQAAAAAGAGVPWGRPVSCQPVAMLPLTLRGASRGAAVPRPPGRRLGLRVAAAAGEGGSEVQFKGGVGFAKKATAPNFTGSQQGIVLLSDIFGFRTENIRIVADFLCDKGYDVVVPDLFLMRPWPPGKPVGEGFEEWRERWAGPPDRVLGVVASAAAHLRRAGCGSVGLVGFCYGGGKVVEALAGDPRGEMYQAAATFYATRVDPRDAREIRVPILMTFADQDHLVPAQQRGDIAEALRLCPAPNKVNVFVGRAHGFAHMPNLSDQAETADADKAMEEMYYWFTKHLK